MPEETITQEAPQDLRRNSVAPDETQTTKAEEAGAGAGDTPQTTSVEKKEETPSAPAPRRIKIDEEEVEEEALIKAYKTRREAQQKLMEAEKLQKAHKNLLLKIPESPRETFIEIFSGKLGGKAQAEAAWLQLCQEETIRDYERKQLPEPERKALTLQDELDQTRKRLKELEDQRSAEAREYQEAQTIRSLLQDATAALKKAGLPQTDDALDGVLSKLLALKEAGYEAGAQEALEFYQEDLKKRKVDLAKTYSLDELLSYVPDLEKQVLERSLARAKAQKSAPPQRQPSQAERPPPEGNGTVKRTPVPPSRFLKF